MRTLVLSILWAFAGNFGTAAKIPVKPHFQASLLMGKWYPISLATDHEGRDHLSVVGRFILAMPPNDLSVDLEYIEGEECYIEIVNFRHKERPGQFITESDNPEFDGCKIHIVDTDYSKYNIFHMERNGNSTLFLDVDGPTVSASTRERFKALASSLGFAVENIFDIPLSDICHQDKLFW